MAGKQIVDFHINLNHQTVQETKFTNEFLPCCRYTSQTICRVVPAGYKKNLSSNVKDRDSGHMHEQDLAIATSHKAQAQVPEVQNRPLATRQHSSKDELLVSNSPCRETSSAKTQKCLVIRCTKSPEN